MEHRSWWERVNCALAVGCFAAATACNAELGDAGVEQGAETEATETVEQAVSGSYRHAYVTYESTKTMTEWPANEQFCVMAGIRGETLDFRLSGGRGNSWRAATNDETAGWVTCFPLDNFRGPSGSEFMISGDSGECDTTSDRNCWWGDAGTFLRWMAGSYYGGGEYVRTFQSTSPTSPSTVVAYNANINVVKGGGKSIFFGVPGGKKLVRLMGYTSDGLVKGTVTTSGTFLMSVSTYSGYSSYWLSPTDAAFCGFTKVGGEFNGGGEIARISPTDGWWFLNSINGSGDVWASARCMAWDQN